jgi:hypothetical protein
MMIGGTNSMKPPKLVLAEDLRVDNEIYVGQPALSCLLSAVALEFRFVPVDEAHAEGLARIDTMMRWALPEFEPWLLLGDYGWRPNRPLYRYTTLWHRVKKNALIPEGERLAERVIESPKGIKFFTALRPGTVDPASIDQLLHGTGSFAFAYMRCSHAREIAEGLIAAGWGPLRSPGLFCPEFSSPLCKGSMLIYCPLGAHDDADAGAALVGHPELIRKAHAALS